MMTLQNKTLAIVMGGGAGTRLFPLTQKRAKPAVPLAGKYRLVDIPISNCLNSGFRQVYVLTQFNSESLHRHITASYKFDSFSRSFVEILAAQQTPEGARWYQGTADAVRQNLQYFLEQPYDHYIILSGDQLYRMDYGDLLQAHLQTGADVTLGTTPVDRQAASGFGILHSNAKRHIFRFEETPKDPKLLDELRIPPDLLNELGRPADAELYQGSMGIYVFNRQILIEALANDHDDFGKHIIPASLQKYKVFAVGVEKPSEEIFQYALGRAGVPASRAVHVGNRLDSDVRPAKRLGLRTVWVLRGDAPPAPTLEQLAEPDAVVTSLIGLPTALSRLMSATTIALAS